MGRLSLISEFVGLAVRRKRYWMIPTVVLLLLLGMLIVLTAHSALAPFIYTVF